MTYRFNYKNKFQPVSLEQEESSIDEKSNKNPFRSKPETNIKSSIEFDDQPVANLADEGDDDVIDSNEPSDDSIQTTDTDKPMSKVSFTEFLQVMSKAFATAAQSFTGGKSEDIDFKDVNNDEDDFSQDDNLDIMDDNQDQSNQDSNETDEFSFGDDSDIEKEGEDFFDEDGEDGEDSEFGDEDGEPDRQGDVRYVKGAHLVFRREDPEEGTFEELWIFNTGKDAVRKSDSILRDILSGTEIDPSQIRSEDGTQTYSAWSVGNAQMVHVKGLPS